MRYQTPNFKVGMGLHPSHFSYLEQHPLTDVAWFEAASEDYMNPLGRSMEVLENLRHDYPIALHGSHLNIGNPEGVDSSYLRELRDLIERVEPFLVSDHLAWTGGSRENLHGLFPLPLDQESLQVVCNNIDSVQSQLKTSIALENIATYVDFKNNEKSEAEFLGEVAKRTGCGLVLDLGALFVNSQNHGFNPHKYLQNLPLNKVVQVHLSGPTETESYWLDRKASEITRPIWDLFKYLTPHIRHLPIAIERHRNIPEFSELEMEVIKASFILENNNELERSTASV
ncbi:DUF692 domain-containing protein [Bdellovibrio sp. KM01]|uniref:DUF692 domain-containing protein n=1 Tax=Bdellovibrio sp. KM01 TaxID=2748865 RepID=UPI0015EA18FA|nr:DUF692 domain-containing protein [Bdellovibrio sp. KM01]QLY26143.1 DUF692 domain-containing protein [Bdellovibrio sp. KM01]